MHEQVLNVDYATQIHDAHTIKKLEEQVKNFQAKEEEFNKSIEKNKEMKRDGKELTLKYKACKKKL